MFKINYLFLNISEGDRPDKKNVLVILTDGDAQEHEKTMDAARSIKSTGVHVVVVKIGTQFNENLLHGKENN